MNKQGAWKDILDKRIIVFLLIVLLSSELHASGWSGNLGNAILIGLMWLGVFFLSPYLLLAVAYYFARLRRRHPIVLVLFAILSVFSTLTLCYAIFLLMHGIFWLFLVIAAFGGSIVYFLRRLYFFGIANRIEG